MISRALHVTVTNDKKIKIKLSQFYSTDHIQTNTNTKFVGDFKIQEWKYEPPAGISTFLVE